MTNIKLDVTEVTRVLKELLKSHIEEMKTAPKEGLFSKDYVQGQAAGTLTALHLIKALTDKEYEELAKQVYEL